MRYIKHNKGSEGPVNVASFYAAWTQRDIDPKRGIRLQTLSHWALLFSRWECGLWTRHGRDSGRDVPSFWKAVKRLTRRKQTLHLFGHNLPQQAELVGLWGEIEASRLRWLVDSDVAEELGAKARRGYLVSTGIPWLFKGLYEFRSLRITDLRNYVNAPLADFRDSIDQAKVEFVADPSAALTAADTSLVNANIVHAWITNALSTWRSSDIGTWQPTASKLALSAYQHWIGRQSQATPSPSPNGMAHKASATSYSPIVLHDNAAAKLLERQCYHGGISEAYYIGEYTGKLHYLDFRSLYPHLAAESPMPCKLLVCGGKVEPRALAGELKTLVGFADVTIAGPNTLYPLRVTSDKQVRIIPRHDREQLGEWWSGPLTVYPEGCYRTQLCGDELCAAISKGHVAKVHSFSLYSPGYPFGDFFTQWYERRLEAAASDNKIMESLSKIIMNSLLGKLGQRLPDWEDDLSVVAQVPWGEWYHAAAGESKVTRYRSIGWNSQKSVGMVEREYSAIMIPAAVTAAARTIMRSLMQSMPHQSVLLCDTDGLLVTDSGLGHLKDRVQQESGPMGSLRVKDACDHIIIHGPRCYEMNGKLVVAGLHRGWEMTEDGEYAQWLSDWRYSRQLGFPHGSFALHLRPWSRLPKWAGRHGVRGGWTEPLLVGF